MNTLQTSYQALVADESETPHESVIFHVASEGGKSRWNHVGDLDSFFRRIYAFHQKHGLLCIIVEEVIRVTLFALILFGTVYCANCIYFNFDEPPSPFVNRTDTHISELFIPVPVCAASFGFWSWFIIVINIILTVYKIYRLIGTIYSYKEIEQFYDSAMKISKADVSNITWHEVQCRLREVQHEQQMCVHKSDITELDIYHRILRYKNYMVAMVNKNVLPLKYNVKFLGEWVYLSSGLEYNIELLLFGSVSIFKEKGTLKEDFKKYSKRKEVAAELARNILICGVINLILAPFISIWQLLVAYVTYSGIVRHEPGFLGMRKWSTYSRLYLRHFNELDHELNARLSRAYKPAKEYMRSFSSPLAVIISKFLAQIVGSLVVFLFIWSAAKEKLLLQEHVIMLITCGTIIFYALSSCVPDENAVFLPNQLMLKMIADIHYVPDHFKKMAHTTPVRDEFSHLFQYKFVDLIEELISPVVTPYILIFHLRHRALDIVDFFRSFTVDVAGVGDVCSFALMDVSRHGNHNWLSEGHTKADQYQQAEDGKTELSLIHFTLMNPHWKPPPASNMFIDSFRGQVNLARERHPGAGMENPYYNSLNSLSSMGSKYASLVNSIHQAHAGTNSLVGTMVTSGVAAEKVGMSGGVNRVEGPPYLVQGGLLASLQGNDMGELHSLQTDLNPVEIRAADMSLSALYLHEVHARRIETSEMEERRRESIPEQENIGNEELPLLDVRIANQ